MTRLDLITNVLNSVNINTDNIEVITSNQTSSQYRITNVVIPSQFKSTLTKTSYSDELIDSDNNTVMLFFKRSAIDNNYVNALIKFNYQDDNSYIIDFQVVSFVKYDEDGNEYFE